MIIYLWFALMLIISIVWIVYFIYRPLQINQPNTEQSNIALGKHKKLELQQDLEQKTIDEDSFNQMNKEISITLEQELNSTNANNNNKINTKIIALLLIIFLPLTTIAIYYLISAKNNNIDKFAPISTAQDTLSIEQKITQIKQNISKNPDDFNAWHTLGFYLFEVNKTKEALAAYEKSYQINPKNIALLSEYASVIAISQGNNFAGKPLKLIKEAIKINPNAPDVLYLSGIIALSIKEFDRAEKIWLRALSYTSANTTEYLAIQNSLNYLQKTKQKDNNDIEIIINIDISKQILAGRDINDYLMVYVRPAQGLRMPIAIKKIKLNDFSGTIKLSNNDLVMVNKKISTFNKVVVVARVSKTGLALKQNDDLEVISKVINTDSNKTINLKIK